MNNAAERDEMLDIWKWLKGKPAKVDPIDEPRQRAIDYAEHGCPYCGHGEIEMGPRGGISQNFWCVQCGARYNCHEIPGSPLVDITHGPTKEPWASQHATTEE